MTRLPEPAAAQTKHLRVAQCNSAIVGRGTNAALIECNLVAEKEYAIAIKLQNMGFYETYAARLRTIAMDADAGRISQQQRNNLWDTDFEDYRSAIAQARAVADANRATTTNLIVGAAGALVVGYAGYERAQAAHASSSTYVSRPPQLAPNGTYVSGTPQLAPDGSYVGGTPQMAPNGTYVGGIPQLAPNGTYVGGAPQLAPNGTYVGGTPQLAPNGSYVGSGGQ